MKLYFTGVLLMFSLALGFGQNALNFDGIDDVVTTTYPGISGNGARTIEAWIKTTANANPSTGGSQKTIVDYGSMTPNGARFTFCLLWSNSIRIEVGGNGISGTTAINDGLWHHVAVSYDPNLVSNKFKLYIDGVLEVEGNTTVAVNTSSIVPVQIGKRVDNINLFDGAIDEVRIWNVVRTASEIAQYRNAEFCGLEPGLVAYYKFNEGAPLANNTGIITAYDAAGSNNGTLQNFALLGSGSNWVLGAPIGGGVAQGGTINISACNSYTASNGTVYTSNAQFSDTISGAGACDTAFTVNLTISQATTSTIQITDCASFTSPSGNYTWTQSGNYTDTIANAANCDSVINIQLTIPVINTLVTQNGNTLSSLQSAGLYQWLDCNNGNSAISGATQQSFTPTANGSYAVQLTVDGCTETSACILVTGIGTDENGDSGLNVYPNPNNGEFDIQHNLGGNKLNLEIYDLSGRLVYFEEFETAPILSIQASNLNGGLYVLKISDGTRYQHQRIVVK